MKQLTRVAVGLGSNKGDRLKSLRSAYSKLLEDLLTGAKASSVYETPAWGGVTHHSFLNAVVVGDTDWKPPAIVSFLKNAERELGRTPGQRLGDREIDMDLLVYGEKTWTAEGVVVPHPGLAERDFVLIPLAEIWPDWEHPLLHLSAMALLQKRPSPQVKCIDLLRPI